MKPVQLALFVLIALIAVVVLVLAARNPQPPLLPADAEHARWDGPAACNTCHEPDGPSPKSAKHPIGDDCLRCHGRR